jgi:Holliday junction resolvase
MSNGTPAEHEARKHLVKLGYFALRSPASKGIIDVIAIRPGVVLFVQVKSGKHSATALRPPAWNALYADARTYGAMPVLCVRPWRDTALQWFRLTGPKREGWSGSRQPMEPIDPAWWETSVPSCVHDSPPPAEYERLEEITGIPDVGRAG